MNIVQVKYPPFGNMTPRALASISDFICHHSAGNPDQTPLEIDAEHRNIGDACIAYNWVVGKDGTVYAGRPVEFVPAAAFGRNSQSVNVCLTGNFQADDAGYTGPPTSQQMSSLNDLCLWAHKQSPTIVRTIGHRDVATMFYPNDTAPYATACPGSELYKQIDDVIKYVSGHLSKL